MSKLYSKYRYDFHHIFGQGLAFSDFRKGDKNHDRILSKREFIEWGKAQDKSIKGVERIDGEENPKDQRHLKRMTSIQRKTKKEIPRLKTLGTIS
eukprot:UN10466